MSLPSALKRISVKKATNKKNEDVELAIVATKKALDISQEKNPTGIFLNPFSINALTFTAFQEENITSKEDFGTRRQRLVFQLAPSGANNEYRELLNKIESGINEKEKSEILRESRRESSRYD
jgi:hypothetical protein